jgi:S-DNA-T family DNA segregation ATPase FtsK/SpoIIIE
VAAREWTGTEAPPVRTLPPVVRVEQLPPAPPGAGVVVGVGERDLGPVPLDLTSGDPHFLVYGDPESGKTAFLRTWLRGLVAGSPPTAVKVVMVDLRRTLLEVVPESHLAAYAGSLAAAEVDLTRLRNTLVDRLPPVDVTVRQLRERSWWAGPDVYVVVDDYDLVATATGNPLTPLLELVPQARDVGLHVILARRVAGSSRASFEPFIQRVRETGEQGLLLGGDPSEGQVLGGLKAQQQPPGRGVLVRRRAAPELIQVAWTPDHLPVS